VQGEQWLQTVGQFCIESLEMLGTLGQHQHLVALRELAHDLGGYCRSAGRVARHVPEDLLDARIGGQIDASR
jgi:hypothetical protein